MIPRAAPTSEYNGFRNKNAINNKTPMKIRNDYEGGGLMKGLNNEDLLNGIVGLLGTAGLAYGGKKLYDHLKNKK